MNFGLPSCGAIIQPITTNRIVMVLPMAMRVLFDASGFRYCLYRSIVKIVDAELSIEARELRTAPVIAANMNPLNPPGIRFLMMSG